MLYINLCYLYILILNGDHQIKRARAVFSKKFPTMQKISEGLAELCESLELKHVVVIGDGAGANIAARLAVSIVPSSYCSLARSLAKTFVLELS